MTDFAKLVKQRQESQRSVDFAAQVLRKKNEQAQETDRAASVAARGETVEREGLQSPTLRFALSRGDNLEEKQRIFKEQFPDGELIEVPESMVLGTRRELIFKKNANDPNERFKSVERGEAMPNTLTEMFADTAEFIGQDAGPFMAEAATFAIPQLRGAKYGKQALAAAAAAGSGELAEQGLQEASGVNTQSLGDVGKQSGMQAGAAGAGTLLFGPLANRAVNTSRGAGMLKLREGADDAEQARQFLNQRLRDDQQIPPFTPGQLAETPVIQRLDEQSIALAGGLREQRRKQIAGVGRATRGAASMRDLGRSRRRAVTALEREQRDLVSAIRGSGDFEASGESLKSSLESYSKNSQGNVSTLYDTAANLAPGEGPSFDLAPVIGVADELTAGVRAAARPERVKPSDGLSDLERFSATGDVDEVVGGVVDAQGSIDSELSSVITDLRKIDPNFPSGENIAPSWQVLDNLRQRLFDLKTPNPGEPFRRSHRQAASLYEAITRTIDNPIGGGEAFSSAWDQARKAASDRYRNLELSNIVRLARTDETTGFAQRLAQPGASDALRQLGSVLDEKTMRTVTDAFKRDLASDLGNMGNTLRSFDRETLRRLVSPDELKRLEGIAGDVARLESSGIQNALNRQTRNRMFVRDLITRDDSAGADALLGVIRNEGGRNSPLGRSVRAGIVDQIFDDVVRIQADGGKVTLDEVTKRLKKIDALGLGRLLNGNDRKIIRSVMYVAPFVKVTKGGAGASIQAADVAENLVSFGDPKAQLGGIASIIQKIGYARTMQMPWVRAMLVGGGKRKVNPNRTLSAIGAILGTAMSDLEQEQEVKDLQETN